MEYRIEFDKDNIFKVIKIKHADIRFLQEHKEDEVFKGNITDCKSFIEMSKNGTLTKPNN